MGKVEKHADEIMDEIYNDWGPTKGLEIEEELLDILITYYEKGK